MAVNLAAPDPSALLAIKGVQLGVTEAGVRKANRKDLLLMTLAAGTRVAGVFTRNRFCAAPVAVAFALAVKPATPAALIAATLEYAEPTLSPASALPAKLAEPWALAPIETAVPVPTCRVNALPVKPATVVTAPVFEATWPIWSARTPWVKLMAIVLPTLAPTWNTVTPLLPSRTLVPLKLVCEAIRVISAICC